MLGKPEIFGVDIGQYAIKTAHIKQSSSGFTATKLGYELIPDEVRKSRDKEALSKIIADLIKSEKIATGAPVLHITAGDAFIRELSFGEKRLRGDELEGSIELEMTNILPFPLDQVYLDFDETPNDQGNYLAVAGKRDVIDPKTALVSNLGKKFQEPQVDVDAFAFGRVLDSLGYLSADEAVMLVDVGYNRTRYYVYHQGELIFNREVQIGGYQATEIIRDVFDIDENLAENKKISNSVGTDYEELVLMPYVQMFVEQMNLVLDFFESSNTNQVALKTAYFTGGGSVLHGLIGGVKERSNIDIQSLAFANRIKAKLSVGGESLREGLHHSLAIGLALEGKK